MPPLPDAPAGAEAPQLRRQLEFYETNGYLVVPGALDREEVAALNAAVDADLEANPTLWQTRGNARLTVHVLMAHPVMDGTMRPVGLLPLLEAIMGPELCAEEHSVRIRVPNPDGEPECHWHRDAQRPDPGVPFRTRYLSVVFYLSDVDATTHTFSVIPGSGQGEELPPVEAYDLGAAHHIEGPAGTAVLFNTATIHAGNVRRTDRERRTIHIYCGRSSDRHLSNYTIFPGRLLYAEEESVRRYYGRPNAITRLVQDHFGGGNS